MYILHPHDESTIVLGDFFDPANQTQPRQDSVSFIQERDLEFGEAEEKAGLGMNNVARSHLLLARSGLPERIIDDLKLKVD